MQGQTSLCGPAAVVEALADTKPLGYAELVDEVYVDGTVHGAEVGGALRGMSLKGTYTNPCDYMVLAAVKDAHAPRLGYHGPGHLFGLLEKIEGGTGHGGMAELIETLLGDPAAEEVDFDGTVGALEAIGARVGAGDLVFVSVDGRRLKGKEPDLWQRIKNIFGDSDHWVRLLSPPTVGPGGVKLRLFTWRDAMEFTIPVDALGDVIHDFIVATRPAETPKEEGRR